jgi:Trp operon repressor
LLLLQAEIDAMMDRQGIVTDLLWPVCGDKVLLLLLLQAEIDAMMDRQDIVKADLSSCKIN